MLVPPSSPLYGQHYPPQMLPPHPPHVGYGHSYGLPPPPSPYQHRGPPPHGHYGPYPYDQQQHLQQYAEPPSKDEMWALDYLNLQHKYDAETAAMFNSLPR